MKLSLLFVLASIAACSAPPDGDSDRAASEAATAVAPPRPIAPASLARSTTNKPRFRVQLAQGTTGARIQICADRACSIVEQSFDLTTQPGSPASELSPGVHFWRAFGKSGGAVGTRPSPTWELVVDARPAT